MKSNGFTMIELLITMSIIAILAAIAIPTYSTYKRTANRVDATRSLTVAAQGMERCYSQTFAYTGPSCQTAAGTTPSSAGLYSVTVSVTTTPATYTITAVPAAGSPQQSDTTCQQFSVNSAAQQAAQDGSANNTTATCWGST